MNQAVLRQRPRKGLEKRMTWRRWLRRRANRPLFFIDSVTSAPYMVLWIVLILLAFVVTRGSWSFSTVSLSRAAFKAEMNVFAGRRFVFCVTPGRSGSKYMKAVLNAASDIISLHEPHPQMNDGVLRSVIIEGKRRETLEMRSKMKLESIAKIMYGTPAGVAYAETSHMFVKTFADVVLNALENVSREVVILYVHRDLADVVLSQMRLGWFQPSHSGNKVWYYNIEDVHASERVINATGLFSDSKLDTAIGYNLDIRRRADKLKEYVRKQKDQGLLNNVQEVDVSLHDLDATKSKNVESFLRTIGLQPDVGRLAVLGMQEVNSRDFKKDQAHSEITKDDVRQRLDQLSGMIASV